MIKSMTGFGKASLNINNNKITVEIKSLNSKNLNLQVRSPEKYNEKELHIRNIVGKELERGKINMLITIDSENNDNFSLNKSVIDNYYKNISEIANLYNHNVQEEQLLQIIMKLPNVLKNTQEDLSENEWLKLQETINNAIIKLENFRKQEGKSLENDILNNVKNIASLLESVKPFENERIINFKTKLESKLSEATGAENIDNNRFEQELIYYIEKFDINEEKIRLANHCNYFIETVEKEDSAGRKLAFISQEIGREVNTLGSKANHSEIQKIVVQMKDNLEKIKEQLLNVL